MDIQKGYVTAVLHKLDKLAGGSLELKTPLSSAGVRGTSSEEERESYRRNVPLGRLGTPEDVAGACVLLASPLAGFIAGASIVVDGGELS